jgi:hypothetical protein
VPRRLVWFVPVVAILFARIWLSWDSLAAAIVAPGAGLIGIGIGIVVLWRKRRVR